MPCIDCHGHPQPCRHAAATETAATAAATGDQVEHFDQHEVAGQGLKHKLRVNAVTVGPLGDMARMMAEALAGLMESAGGLSP